MAADTERGRSNRFFGSKPHYDDAPKRRVYAVLEVPEDEPRQGGASLPPEPIYLECVDADWIDSIREAPQRVHDPELFREAPISVLELEKYPPPAFPAGLAPGENAWFIVIYSQTVEGENDARSYQALFSPGAPVRINFQEPMPADWARVGPLGDGKLFLERISQLSPRYVRQWTREEMSNVDCGGGVAIYDVGQGACQAVLDSQMLPALYVDFGGGVLGNAKTFPTEYYGFCFTKNPSIVLSHWDWDHWSSAYRFPRALDADWVTPPVARKPIQEAFAADLCSRGKLHIWANSFPQRSRCNGIQVERCSGRTTNDSGLAVTVYPGAGSRRNCLLPGDATYRFIPSVAGGARFDAMSITHHGGRLHSALIPAPKRGAKMACSVGAGNSYKHPFLDTFEAHTGVGWPLPLSTGFTGTRPSHVLLPWEGAARPFIGRCFAGKPQCSVAGPLEP